MKDMLKKKALAVAAAALACAALAAEAPQEKAKYKDPNPFAAYGPAMESTEKDPLAAVWSAAHDAEIAAATEESALADAVSSREAADALLGQVKGAYETPPLVMIKIAAVTQWVMLPDPFCLFFWKPCPSDGRAIWKAALEARIAGTSDAYIRAFCRQQLDLCR